jgi:hypothetical protein
MKAKQKSSSRYEHWLGPSSVGRLQLHVSRCSFQVWSMIVIPRNQAIQVRRGIDYLPSWMVWGRPCQSFFLDRSIRIPYHDQVDIMYSGSLESIQIDDCKMPRAGDVVYQMGISVLSSRVNSFAPCRRGQRRVVHGWIRPGPDVWTTHLSRIYTLCVRVYTQDKSFPSLTG